MLRHSKCIALVSKGVLCRGSQLSHLESRMEPGRRQADTHGRGEVLRGGVPFDSSTQGRRTRGVQVLCLMRNAGGKQRPAPCLVQAKDFMQKVVALVVAAATKGAGGDVSRVCTV